MIGKRVIIRGIPEVPMTVVGLHSSDAWICAYPVAVNGRMEIDTEVVEEKALEKIKE